MNIATILICILSSDIPLVLSFCTRTLDLLMHRRRLLDACGYPSRPPAELILFLLLCTVAEVFLLLLCNLGSHTSVGFLEKLSLALEPHLFRYTRYLGTLDFWSVWQILEEIVIISDLVDFRVGALFHDWLDIVLSKHKMVWVHFLEEHKLEVSFWRSHEQTVR